MSIDVLEFAIFCIENVANELKITGDEAFVLLAKKTSILDEYIIANYDILHTQGREYIVNDVIDCMKNKGVI